MSRANPRPGNDDAPLDYRSPMEEWDTRSWVRAKPHQLAGFDASLEFFSADLAPIMDSPEIVERPGVRRRLLVLHLYQWLHFTEWLEMGPVNTACDLLRQRSFWPWLPAEMKADALKIYVDEGGHAEMSHALVTRVEAATGISARLLRDHAPSTKLFYEQMLDTSETAMAPLLTIFFAFVSETLITGSIKRLPKDRTVQRAVRDLAADHAADEALHHAYFRALFGTTWPRLEDAERTYVLRWLPEMILAFLLPDRDALLRMLADAAPELEAASLVDSLLTSRALDRSMRRAAMPTLRILNASGLFADPEIVVAFARHGLHPPDRRNAGTES